MCVCEWGTSVSTHMWQCVWGFQGRLWGVGLCLPPCWGRVSVLCCVVQAGWPEASSGWFSCSCLLSHHRTCKMTDVSTVSCTLRSSGLCRQCVYSLSHLLGPDFLLCLFDPYFSDVSVSLEIVPFDWLVVTPSGKAHEGLFSISVRPSSGTWVNIEEPGIWSLLHLLSHSWQRLGSVTSFSSVLLCHLFP